MRYNTVQKQQFAGLHMDLETVSQFYLSSLSTKIVALAVFQPFHTLAGIGASFVYNVGPDICQGCWV